MTANRMTYSTRVTVPGIFGLVMMGLFDLAYVLVTPCRLEIAADSYNVLWAYEGCSFGMHTGGLIVSSIGALIGLGLGWLVT